MASDYLASEGQALGTGSKTIQVNLGDWEEIIIHGAGVRIRLDREQIDNLIRAIDRLSSSGE